MNKVCLVGRITRDVELRYTPNGTAICGFNLAIDREYLNADGTRPTDFIPCVAIGNPAVFMGSYVHKGNLLSITGSIQTRQYQTQNGENRAVTEVKCDSVNNLSPKPLETQNKPNNVPNNKPQEQKQQPNSFGLDNEDDTLPWL